MSHLMTVYTRSTFMSFHFVFTKLINTTKPSYVTLTSALVGRPVSCRPPDCLMFFLFLFLNVFKQIRDLKREDCMEIEGAVWRVAIHCRRLITVYSEIYISGNGSQTCRLAVYLQSFAARK